ncbi:MAG: sulfatase/phosphatase domain-containing protein, partial [Verrucomicrobiota bacterium]
PRYFNAGMRGSKTELWEGGHRVPCFIRWPKGNLGEPRDIGGLTQVQDLLPTVLAMCEVERVDGPDFDGMNLLPVLRGETEISDDRILVINYSRMPGFTAIPSPYSQTQMSAEQAGVLWKRWRLLENRELYNLETDPLQQKNVIEEHPEVVAKMREALYANWEKIKDFANEPQRMIVGDPRENPSKLSATEWLDVFVDQQGQIRRGVKKSGFWMIDVAEAGEYDIELRRWPREVDAPISGVPSVDAKGCRALPIETASLYLTGHNHLSIGEKKPYSFEGLTQPVGKEDKAAVFTMNLKKGPTTLHTWFRGPSLDISAYYVYVTKK